MAKEKKPRKQKIDSRPEESLEWRQYLMDPTSVPVSREDCPCPKKKCDRRGKCRECYEFHLAGKRLPFCIRKK